MRLRWPLVLVLMNTTWQCQVSELRIPTLFFPVFPVLLYFGLYCSLLDSCLFYVTIYILYFCHSWSFGSSPEVGQWPLPGGEAELKSWPAVISWSHMAECQSQSEVRNQKQQNPTTCPLFTTGAESILFALASPVHGFLSGLMVTERSWPSESEICFWVSLHKMLCSFGC